MFDGFELATVDTGEALIRVRHGGSGPPLLLLHGNPQTMAMWHLVAPRLATEFTVVAADLRGYGDSSKPPSAPDHAPSGRCAPPACRRLPSQRAGHVARVCGFGWPPWAARKPQGCRDGLTPYAAPTT